MHLYGHPLYVSRGTILNILPPNPRKTKVCRRARRPRRPCPRRPARRKSASSAPGSSASTARWSWSSRGSRSRSSIGPSRARAVPSAMRAFYQFLKNSSWNLPQKIHPAPDQNPLQPGRPPKLLNGPLVTKGITMKISFGFPSVPLRFRGYVILETFGPPGANWIWGELKLPEAVLNKGSLTREKR